MDVGSTGQKTQSLVGNAIAEIGRLEVVRLLVKVVGLFVVLPCLGVSSLVIQGLRVIGGAAWQNPDSHDQQDGRRANPTFHRRSSHRQSSARRVGLNLRSELPNAAVK